MQDITPRDVLSTSEESALSQYESTIERGLQTFYEVGNALAAIRDGGLYRSNYPTFEQYCQDRWGMGRNYVNKLVAASEVVDNLGTIVPTLPTNESQVRPLTKLAPEDQPIAWQRAVETAPNGKVTGSHVASVVKEMQAPAIPPRPVPTYSDLRSMLDTHRADEWPDDLINDEPPDDLPVRIIPPVTSIRDQQRQVLTSRKSEEWYTPLWCADAARQVYGPITLDPASSKEANAVIQATRYYTLDDNGLYRPWVGATFFMNPPYNGEAAKWCKWAVNQYQSGNIGQGILLVFAKLGYNWFEELWNTYPTCFVRERIHFTRPSPTSPDYTPPKDDKQNDDEDEGDGSKGKVAKDGAAKHASAFIYFGSNRDRFREVFSAFGRVIFPEEG